jgi:hypothetical protein
MADDLDSVGLGSLQHHGANALATARHFGGLDLTVIPESGDSVFFTIRPLFVRYPVWLAPVLALAAAAVLAWAATGRRRPGAVSPGSMARWTGASALGALVGTVVGTLVWVGLAALRSSPAVPEAYTYLAMILLIGVLVARWVAARVGRRDAPSRRYGGVAVWVVLALVTAVVLPGFSYLFAWPALASAAGLMWPVRRPGWGVARFTAVAVPTLLLLTPAVDYLFSYAQPRPGNLDSQVTAVMVVPLLLGVLAVTLLASGWHRPDAGTAPPHVPGETGPRWRL